MSLSFLRRQISSVAFVGLVIHATATPAAAAVTCGVDASVRANIAREVEMARALNSWELPLLSQMYVGRLSANDATENQLFDTGLKRVAGQSVGTRLSTPIGIHYSWFEDPNCPDSPDTCQTHVELDDTSLVLVFVGAYWCLDMWGMPVFVPAVWHNQALYNQCMSDPNCYNNATRSGGC